MYAPFSSAVPATTEILMGIFAPTFPTVVRHTCTSSPSVSVMSVGEGIISTVGEKIAR